MAKAKYSMETDAVKTVEFGNAVTEFFWDKLEMKSGTAIQPENSRFIMLVLQIVTSNILKTMEMNWTGTKEQLFEHFLKGVLEVQTKLPTSWIGKEDESELESVQLRRG